MLTRYPKPELFSIRYQIREIFQHPSRASPEPQIWPEPDLFYGSWPRPTLDTNFVFQKSRNKIFVHLFTQLYFTLNLPRFSPPGWGISYSEILDYTLITQSENNSSSHI